MSRTHLRPPRRPSWAALCAPLLLGASVFALPEEPPLLDTGPYQKLTNSWFSVTNFNVETVRGFCYGPWASDGTNVLYALNTHRSAVRRYRAGAQAAELLWPTVNNPISLAVWEPDAGSSWRTPQTDHLVIVVGGGTHAVVAHVPNAGAPDDGAMKAVLQLPSEPQDIVIDAANRKGYVSCAGTQEVVRFDLETFTEEARYFIPGPRPKFLFFDGGLVYVAPEISGNNTTFAREQGMAVAVDLYDPTVYPDTSKAVGELSDDDLYAIDPASGAVTPVVKRAGVILQEFARRPGGKWWMLNIDSQNADPARRSEPALKGEFARNRLTIVSSGEATDFKDLDAGAGAKSVAFPWALDFDPTGFAAIVGSTSDRLQLRDPNGDRIGEVDLPPGSIPRDVEFIENGTLVLVYCWGSNQVLTYGTAQVVNQIVAPTTGFGPLLVRDLGVDPLPEAVREGRATFYSATRSSGGTTGAGAGRERFTCATCHPGGRTDQLVWSLGDIPHDFKDGMLTQSLMGLLDTFPFHWRGERDLAAFNVAFEGLLGGTKLSELRVNGASELDEFEAFVFSMVPPANPLENPARVLDNARRSHLRANGKAGRATVGQQVYQQPGTLLGLSCVQCHSLETGSNGIFSADETETRVPTNVNMDPTHLRQLASRFLQEEVQLGPIFSPKDGSLIGGNGLHNTRGFGFSHDGNDATVFRFLTPTQPGVTAAFTLSPQEWADVTSFVEQFDSGMAPRAHAAYLLDAATVAAGMQGRIASELLPQANLLWIDIAVLGTVTDAAGNLRRVNWWWDPWGGLFRANDASVQIGQNPPGVALLSQLADQAALGQASNVFLGLPPGNGRRFAADPDNDGMLDGEELAWPTPTDPEVPDSDGDGWQDGHEAANGGDPASSLTIPVDVTPPTVVGAIGDHTAGSFAKVLIEFSEPVTYTIQAMENGAPVGPVQHRVALRARDTLYAHHLVPSLPGATLKDYSFDIVMTDRGFQTGTHTLSGLEKARARIPSGGLTANGLNLRLVVEDITWDPTSVMSGPTFKAKAKVQIAAPEFLGTPPAGWNVLCNVAVFDSTTQSWHGAPPFTSPDIRTSLRFVTVPGATWDPTPTVSESFLLSPPTTPAGPVGEATLTFDVPNLSSGDRVQLNVLAILQEQPGAPPGSFQIGEIANYVMPETDPAARSLVFVVP